MKNYLSALNTINLLFVFYKQIGVCSENNFKDKRKHSKWIIYLKD